MNLGRIVLAAAAVGIGLVLISRSSSAATAPMPAPAAAPGFGGGIAGAPVNFGPVLPQLGPAYAVLKPIADHFTTPIIKGLNNAVGGVDFEGTLTKNADGTYTDGAGYTIKYAADGTYTRYKKNPNWYERHVGEPISRGATGVVHAIEGLF